MPKYWFTSQKPASLTCEKNSEPEPTASTTNATWPLLMPSTRPSINDDAVTVATVADPVASRISTAITHASSNTETWAPLAQSASIVPIPLSTRICLNPPPAATIKMMPATGGRPDATHFANSSRDIPTPTPKVNMPTTTAMSSATNGVPRTSKTTRNGLLSSLTKTSTTALPSISATGTSTLNSVIPNEGRRHPCSVRSRRISSAGAGPPDSLVGNVSGASITTQRPASLPKSGPATITVGIATDTPSANVMPRSACRLAIATSGPGCGGTRPCIAEKPANAGIPTVISDCCDRRATK